MNSREEVESRVDTWTLRLNRGETNYNVAKFEEIWSTGGGVKRKVPRAPVDDPKIFNPPCYMYRKQEVEEHSEDEDYGGPEKIDAFDRPAFKRRVMNQSAIQWVLEDKNDYSKKNGGVKYVGYKTDQASKYAIFRASATQRGVIEVTPIHEWWYFKRPPREEGKMSVKEAEELMKKQEHFVGPLSLANKIEKIIKTDEAARGAVAAGAEGKHGDLDREDTQVLKESGVAPDDSDMGGGEGGAVVRGRGVGKERSIHDESSEGGEADFLEGDGALSEAAGEDDDFGDDVRSDDEEEGGNDDANAEGGILHQDDEDLNDSEDGYASEEDEEISELRKLSRNVNADGEEKKDECNGFNPSSANGDPVRASMMLSGSGNLAAPTHPAAGRDNPPTAPATSSARGDLGSGVGGATGTGKMSTDATGGDGFDHRGTNGAGAGGLVGGSVQSAERNRKQSRKTVRKSKKEINRENVVATLKLHGGRLSSKHVLGQFMSALKKSDNKSAVTKLREILNKVANKVDDAIDGQVWVLKRHFS